MTTVPAPLTRPRPPITSSEQNQSLAVSGTETSSTDSTEAAIGEFEIVNVILTGNNTLQTRPKCKYCQHAFPELNDVGVNE
jgi:hypothetical protein